MTLSSLAQLNHDNLETAVPVDLLKIGDVILYRGRAWQVLGTGRREVEGRGPRAAVYIRDMTPWGLFEEMWINDIDLAAGAKVYGTVSRFKNPHQIYK